MMSPFTCTPVRQASRRSGHAFRQSASPSRSVERGASATRSPASKSSAGAATRVPPRAPPGVRNRPSRSTSRATGTSGSSGAAPSSAATASIRSVPEHVLPDAGGEVAPMQEGHRPVRGRVEPPRVAVVEHPGALERGEPVDLPRRADREADEHGCDERRQDDARPARDEDRGGDEPGAGEREEELQRPCRGPFGELPSGMIAEGIESRLRHREPLHREQDGRRGDGQGGQLRSQAGAGQAAAEPEPEDEEERRRDREEVALRDVVDPAGGERPDLHHDGDRPGGRDCDERPRRGIRLAPLRRIRGP